MSNTFNDLAHVYDAMIDWPKRLEHEGRFYRDLFEQNRVHNVVDVACGSGRHAAMFQSWGLQVEAADVSPAMIERARSIFGEPPGLRWVVRAFDAPVAPETPFDAAICVGNSLPLAADENIVRRAIGEMLAAVRNGGLIVVHVLNIARLSDGPCVWQKSRRAVLPQGEMIVLKGIHRCGSRGYVELIVIDPEDGRLVASEAAPLLGLAESDLRKMVSDAGAEKIRFYGGYSGEPFNGRESTDLLMTAHKA
jgi:glycine/sarcosine/dimethylglycine N-methyltransferase